jgi:hypothetical protein
MTFLDVAQAIQINESLVFGEYAVSKIQPFLFTGNLL